MSRSSPYAGHSDFYLLDLWQRRAEMSAKDRDVLVVEMRERGMDIVEDAGESATEPYRDPAPPTDPRAVCPVCGRGMREGDVAVQREKSVLGIFSSQELPVHLYFQRRGGDATIVVRHDEPRPSAMCEDCGTVVVRGQFAK